MKRVIRQSVFETNSSSTHSIVYKRKTDVDYIERLNKKLFAHRCTGGSKIENNLDKLILVLALLNHAKIEGQEYASYAESCLNKYFTNKTKFRNSLMETFIDLIDKDNVLSVACNDYYFKKGDKYVFDHFGVVLEEFSKEEFLIHLQIFSTDLKLFAESRQRE